MGIINSKKFKPPEIETPETKANKLFDQLHNLFNKQEPVTTETKAESIYMLNRFLSLSVQGFLPAVDCNSHSKVPEWAKLPSLYYSIPKQSPPKIKYPKAGKEKLPPRRKMALLRIQSLFCVNNFHSEQILLLLEGQGVKVEAE